MEKVAIIVLVKNRPEFILKQLDTFKNYLVEDFELIMAYDDKKSEAIKEILKICSENKIKTVKIKREFFLAFKHGVRQFISVMFSKRFYDGAVSVGYGLNWVWKRVVPQLNSEYLMVIDSDMFFISEFSIKEFLKNKSIGMVPQFRGDRLEIFYPWNGLIILDLKLVKGINRMDWLPGKVNGIRCDVGGHNHNWLINTQQLDSIKFINFLNLFEVEDSEDKVQVKLLLNGNWVYTLKLNKLTNEIEYRINGKDYDPVDLVLPRKVLEQNFELMDLDDLILRLLDKTKEFGFPSPPYFDLMGEYNEITKFKFYVFHFKSGANYNPWQTHDYNVKKLKSLESVLDGGFNSV